MRRSTVILLLAAALVSTVAAQQRKRIAVLDFDYATVRSEASSIFGTDRDLGKGIADLIVEKLVNGNSYSVIERKAIDKILAEQNFSNSDRADAAFLAWTRSSSEASPSLAATTRTRGSTAARCRT
jgi:curli biogenesis system outer membrane secretion channel CsgG